MKIVYFSHHAISRMRLYDIKQEWVVLTIYEPEKIIPSIKGRYNAFRRSGDKILRVTYSEEALRYVVITVTPRTRF